jgi:hypothetical protein
MRGMGGEGLMRSLDPHCLYEYYRAVRSWSQAFASLRAVFSSVISPLRVLTSLAIS